MKQYKSVFFGQDEKATGYLEIYQTHGPRGLFENLTTNYDLSTGEILDDPPWGQNDEVHHFGNYVLAVNEMVGYISLTEVLEV